METHIHLQSQQQEREKGGLWTLKTKPKGEDRKWGTISIPRFTFPIFENRIQETGGLLKTVTGWSIPLGLSQWIHVKRKRKTYGREVAD